VPAALDRAPSARASCAPQSQRVEPNTSPVRHSECTRDEHGVFGLRVAHHERDVRAILELGMERVDRPRAARRSEAPRGDARDEALGAHAVAG
jgi:hypothetical protein